MTTRRYWIKKTNPDIFRRKITVKINGKECADFGNPFLLQDFDKMPVAVHKAELALLPEKRALWHKCADNRGVLVSPFINPKEKDIRDECLARGGRFVIIRHEGTTERFAPQGKWFELCAQGRLLWLTPWPENKMGSPVKRWQCEAMNALAEEICNPESLIEIV